jgi:glycosyltransferase involved in cell wall biosynthesis
MSGQSNRRLMVVSHPAVVPVNQVVYRELAQRGWNVTIVVPDRWRHPYSAKPVIPKPIEDMQAQLTALPVALPGRPQRHFYLASCSSQCTKIRPDVAFIEAEPFSLSAAQWSWTFVRKRVPFGVHCWENIDRALPPPIRWLRGGVLRRASFVAARSDSAARLARTWGARGEVDLALHGVPSWDPVPPSVPRPFTVGYAGRLVEEKGLLDLLEGVRRLEAPVELLLIGNGELRAELEGQSIPGSAVRVLDSLKHEQMASGYAQIDVLALPSHTTPSWKEQFGRVIVEALSCGVPVVGSDSGEIPWLIELTGGGLVFPEGNIDRLADRLDQLRADPGLRERLAAKGGATVETLFSVPAATDALERLLLNASQLSASSP